MHLLHDTTPPIDRLYSNSQVHFIRDIALRVSLTWDCWQATLRMQDLSAAGKAGKICPRLTVEFKNAAHGDSEGLNAMGQFLRRFDNDLQRAFKAVAALPFVPEKYCTPSITEGSTVFHFNPVSAVRVYSPWATYSPLKEIPRRWTVAHVVRALWNGQFENLRCDSRLSDDYAFDAATNFGKREFKDGRAFCQKLIESPSGWWASGTDSVSICCHHFDSNSFKFKLTPVTTACPPCKSFSVAA